eukprot:scaffold494149_cov29-Prasinocladus_malaysianus.AAC.1
MSIRVARVSACQQADRMLVCICLNACCKSSYSTKVHQSIIAVIPGTVCCMSEAVFAAARDNDKF